MKHDDELPDGFAICVLWAAAIVCGAILAVVL